MRATAIAVFTLIVGTSAYGDVIGIQERTIRYHGCMPYFIVRSVADFEAVAWPVACSTDAWGSATAQSEATVTVAYEGGAPVTLGTTSGASLEWTPTKAGTYVFTHEPGGLTGTVVLASDRHMALVGAVGEGVSIHPFLGADGFPTSYLAILERDVVRSIVLPDGLGHVTFDIAGRTLAGTNAVFIGSYDVPGANGGPAITVGEDTALTITDNGNPKGAITGGAGSRGAPFGGAGAPAVSGAYVTDGEVTLVKGQDGEFVPEPVVIDRVQQVYPWNLLKVTVSYTLNLEPDTVYDLAFVFSWNGQAHTNEIARTELTNGSHSLFFDADTVFTGLTDKSQVKVKALLNVRETQLWENGPYWSDCNVGATDPDELGYLFWWGDTVGAKRDGNQWVNVTSGSAVSFTSGIAPTYGKTLAQLVEAGYVDESGKLRPGYDAATHYCHSPWRMPTQDDFRSLRQKCVMTKIGSGNAICYQFRGQGAYSNRRIHLKCGYAVWENLYLTLRYWTSETSPVSIFLGGTNIIQSFALTEADYKEEVLRYYGCPVRPVRDAGSGNE